MLTLAPEPISKAGAVVMWAAAYDEAISWGRGTPTYFEEALRWYHPDMSPLEFRLRMLTKDASLTAISAAPLFRCPPNLVTQNRLIGNDWDVYVQETKLRALDEAGQLDIQERLPTPDLLPDKAYVQPDYTLYNGRGGTAAYGDAKAGAIEFDAQARGLILWAATTESRTLIYYVPKPVEIPPSLINFARQNQVKIQRIVVK